MLDQSLEIDHDYDRRKQPEFILWLAVVYKAVEDYRLLCQHQKNPSMKLEPYVLNVRPFLFGKETKPHNLNWISTMLYGSTGFADDVRKHAEKVAAEGADSKFVGLYIKRRRGSTIF